MASAGLYESFSRFQSASGTFPSVPEDCREFQEHSKAFRWFQGVSGSIMSLPGVFEGYQGISRAILESL